MLDEDIIPQSQLNTEDSNKANIESEKEVRQRLNEGVAKNRENVNGWQLVGTTDNPVETYARTAPMPEDEIDSVIKDVREIKKLLFSRLILEQASVASRD